MMLVRDSNLDSIYLATVLAPESIQLIKKLDQSQEDAKYECGTKEKLANNKEGLS